MKLSYSHLASYKKCPRKYEFEFIKKLPKKITPENAFGISVHSCLSKFGKAEMQNSKFTSLRSGYGRQEMQNDQASLFMEQDSRESSKDLSLDALLNLWNESFVKNGYETKMAADFDRERGERLLEKFFEWWGKEKHRVLGVEKGFKVDIRNPESGIRTKKKIIPDSGSRIPDSVTVTGRFDRVEELDNNTLRIIDFKTGGLKTQGAVDNDLQLSIYALAAKETFGKEASELIMLFLVDEELSEVKTSRTEGELGTAIKTIELLSERIVSEDYTPTPSKEKCRFCPYRRVCDVAAI